MVPKEVERLLNGTRALFPRNKEEIRKEGKVVNIAQL